MSSRFLAANAELHLVEFRILFQDEALVAIEKPPGMLVHRTGISQDRTFVLQELRNQLGKPVFPVHRLDRGTAGVLVMALSPAMARQIQSDLEGAQSNKTYLTIARGWLPPQGHIDAPLEKDGDGPLQDALTEFHCLAHATLPIPVDRYPTARYSLAAVRLHTGRMHQIRRHFAHMRHPVIGDRKRGDRHHNRAWAEQVGIEAMFLFAWRLELPHPVTRQMLRFEAEPTANFTAACTQLGWNLAEFSDFAWP